MSHILVFSVPTSLRLSHNHASTSLLKPISYWQNPDSLKPHNSVIQRTCDVNNIAVFCGYFKYWTTAILFFFSSLNINML